MFDAEFLRRLEYLNLIARKILSGSLKVERPSPRRGTSAEFTDYRSYVAGDDVRHLDWNLFHRLRELFLKLYREEENLHLTVLLDASSSMRFGDPPKWDHARQVAAAIAYLGMANLDRVSVVPFDQRLREGRWGLKGKSRIFELFEFLEPLETGGETNMHTSLREFVEREKKRGVVVVISDFYDLDGYRDGLRSLNFRRHEISALHVIDKAEADPTLRGDLRLVDAETGDIKNVTITDALRRKYRDRFDQFLDDVQRFCVRREIGLLPARTDVSFEEFVLLWLRRGGLVA